MLSLVSGRQCTAVIIYLPRLVMPHDKKYNMCHELSMKRFSWLRCQRFSNWEEMDEVIK
jgi:hypothetical protein